MSKQILSFILPVTVLIIVPFFIEDNFGIALNIFLIVGFPVFLIGLAIFIITVSMFIVIGKGTLAPWSPTQKLVTGGVYAHVRNPMISGVFLMLVGETLVFKSLNIGIWTAIFFVINTLYFKFSEEPGLVKRFGGDYIEYRKNVPMWIPRVKPWNGGKTTHEK